MKIFPGSLLLKTQGLNDVDRVRYYDAVFHLWGAIAMPRQELEDRIGPLSEALLRRFDLHEDGEIYLAWLDDERGTQLRLATKNQRNGTLGGRGIKKKPTGKPTGFTTGKATPASIPVPASSLSTQEGKDNGFETWWTLYHYSKKKPDALRAWGKLNEADRAACLAATPAQVAAQKEGFRPYPASYLNGRMWEDEITAPALNGKPVPMTRAEALAKLDERRAELGIPKGGPIEHHLIPADIATALK